MVKSKQNHFTHTERDVERAMPVMKEVASKLLGSSVERELERERFFAVGKSVLFLI